MPKLGITQFAKSQGLSRQRIHQFVQKGYLISVDGKIDTDQPDNKKWIESRQELPPAPKPVGRCGGERQPPSEEEQEQSDALARLLEASNIQSMAFADVQKVQKIEDALKKRTDRMRVRGELISRDLVRSLFGRLYQVDSQELRTLGSKLAPEVAGLMGIDDPAIVLMVEQRIDGEVLKSLKHIKSLIDEFIKSHADDGRAVTE